MKFEIGFWHPFGPHAGEKAEEIIERKRDEISKNGWTLWSFQFRKSLELWSQEIKNVNPEQVLVFCSAGKGSKDPKSEPKYCNYYLPLGETVHRRIPLEIKVPHPIGKKIKVSAFIVKNILYPVDYETTLIEWLRKDGRWESALLPTKPEYLIRPGKGQAMPRFRAVLELQEPYLAEVGIDPSASADSIEIR